MASTSILIWVLLWSTGWARGDFDPQEVLQWVDQLSSPVRAHRLAAQANLLALSPSAEEFLNGIDRPAGYEARVQLEYVTARLSGVPQAVTIAAGEYRVGSELVQDRNPVRSVQLASFRIDATEVTNLQYFQFVMATGRAPPLQWILNGGRYEYDSERQPVRNVTFQDAQEYCKWAGGRLPTADEWEVAAHLGSGIPFPWGDQPLPRLRNAPGVLVPVQSEPRDVAPSGCFDMAASVSEWVVLEGGRPGYRGGHYLSHSEFFRTVLGPFPVPDGGARGAVGFRVVNRQP